MKRASSTHPLQSVMSVAMLGLLAGVSLYDKRAQSPAFPNETAAGLELLSRRFVGPSYFHIDSEVTNHVAREGNHRYCISVTAAGSQVESVLGERKLSDKQARDLDRLIQKMAEPSKSRVVGETEVNVLRLNLALDSELKNH